MSTFEMEVLPPAVHLADILNGECLCSPAQQQIVQATVIQHAMDYARLIRHLKLLKGGTSDGHTYDLASDLLDEFRL